MLPQGALQPTQGISVNTARVQMDVLRLWGDGSVKHAATAIQLPSIPAGFWIRGTLDIDTPLAGTPPALAITASVVLTPLGGSPTTVNIGAAYAAALLAGTVRYVRRGLFCTEGYIDIAVPALSTDFQLRCALAVFSDGTAPRLEIGFARTLIDIQSTVSTAQVVFTTNMAYDAVVTVNGVTTTYNIGTPGGQTLSFTGQVTDNTVPGNPGYNQLTVTAVQNGGNPVTQEWPRIAPSGMSLITTTVPGGVPFNTTIIGWVTGTGGVGKYKLAQTLVSPITSQAMGAIWTHGLGQVWWHVTGEQDIFQVNDTGLMRSAGAMIHRNDLGALPSAFGTLHGQPAKPLSPGTITQYMPQTGDRNDIGPIPGEQAAFMVSQDPAQWVYCLRNMFASTTIPWNFIDRATSNPPSITTWPNLWAQAAFPGSGFGGYSGWVLDGALNIVGARTTSGWSPQTNHAGRFQWVAWMMTARRAFLDAMEAQASFSMGTTLPLHRQHASGIIVGDPTGYIDPAEPREQAWALAMATIAEGWLPDASPYLAEAKTIITNNIAAMRRFVAFETPLQGEQACHVPWNATPVPPYAFTQQWATDYFVSSVCTLNRQGHNVSDVITAYLPFISGPANNLGWPLTNAVTYQQVVTDVSGNPIQTWAQAAAANDQAIIDKLGPGWTLYQPLNYTTVVGSAVTWSEMFGVCQMAYTDTADSRAHTACTNIQGIATTSNPAAPTLDTGANGAASSFVKFSQLK